MTNPGSHTKYVRYGTLILTTLLMLAVACTEKRAPSTLPSTHPSEWNDRTSADFHGHVALAGGMASCAECHGDDLGGGEVGVSCTECHLTSGACATCHGGLDNTTGAPPFGLEGEIDDTALAVGAHSAHVMGTSSSAAVACSTCHVVPASILDPTHLDLDDSQSPQSLDSIAELTFGGLASRPTAQTVWNRNDRTCANAYCHGNFTGGNSANLPVWTEQAACGSCHDSGSNPSTLLWKHDFHVRTAGLGCNECHANVIDGNLNFIAPGLHVNGAIDTLTNDTAVCNTCHGSGASSCSLCHGGVDNQTGAPPRGLDGETLTSELAVGAHTAHIEGGSLSDAFPCSSCHTVPSATNDVGHLDGDGIAEINYDALAGPASNWDRTAATCQSTYCHGNFLAGNQVNSPEWTGGSTEANCGTCHDVGSNPSSLGWKHQFHVESGLDCAECHNNVVDKSNTITGLSLHVNGVADTLTRDTTVCLQCHGSGTSGCTICHGGTDNQSGAPPVGLEGESATSQLAVGAHSAHLSGGNLADAFSCTDCHVYPDSVLAIGHLGADSIAELTWSTLSGNSSNWNRATGTCASTYCHGNFTGGDGTNSPLWTGGPNESQCGSCHDDGGNPSSLGWKHQFHVESGLDCAECHFNVVDLGNSITGLALHVNGVADTLTRDTTVCLQCHGSGTSGCTICHGGTDNQSGAPPVGLEGESATSQLSVGAHSAHLSGGNLADAFSCTDCHVYPDSVLAIGHLGADSIAELTWSTLSGSSSNWNRATGTCASTYCHGNFTGGDGTNSPLWTGGPNESQCGSCHDDGGNPSSLGWKHQFHVESGLDCAECHFNVVDLGNSITGLALHVNGVADTLTRDTTVCLQCHGSGTSGCTICHGGTDNQSGAPPVGLEGESATSQLAVGAHSAHLSGGNLADAFSCTDCHVYPDSVLAIGHLGADSIAELTWSTLSGNSSNWNRATGTCASTYCHGNFSGGDGTNSPLWTGGSNESQCGSCHDDGGNPSSLGWKHQFHVESGLDCAECHFNVVDLGNSITGLALHVNGVADTLTRDTTVCLQCHGSGTSGCTICHGGTDNQSGAPPVGLEGESATSQLAVGAHSAHLSGGNLADAFSCTDCHLYPDSVLAMGHLGADSIAELTWSTLSGNSSNWNRATGTCASTYCHGNFTGGDGTNSPLWTGGSTEANCGTCHDDGGNPSNLLWHHEYHIITGNLECADCHFNVVDLAGDISDISLHVNGAIDTLTRDTAVCNVCHGSGPVACTGCHGGTDNLTGAPPDGLEGETAISDLAVGAHTAHATGGSQADGFDCTACHIKPAGLIAPGHLDGDDIAEITWGDIAPAPSVSWNRSTATCQNTYCHGNFNGGDHTNSPVWTSAGAASCGSCHDVGSNPANLGWKHAYHVSAANLDCVECHASVVNLAGNIINLALHVNGSIDTLTRDQAVCDDCHGSGSNSCTVCHGGTDNLTGAPPDGLEGETNSTQLAVGAHSAHVEGGSIADAFLCTECHFYPDSVFAPGHLGVDSIAEINWGSLSGGASSWDRGSATCSNTYCHGNFNAGDAANTPIWTGASQAQCGSCHDDGANPADLGWAHDVHVRVFTVACDQCHGNVVNASNAITNLALHVNGQADTLTNPATCDLCHGSSQAACYGCHGGIDNQTGAPPRGIRDELLTTDLAVGAHTAHMEGGTLSDGVECNDCHLVPQNFGDPGHYDIDSVAEMVWSNLAGASSSWNRGAATCNNTYCHGNFSGGDGGNAPVWTAANQAACGSCHDDGSNPQQLSGKHDKHITDKGIACYECHNSVMNSSDQIIDGSLHVNGLKNVEFSAGGVWNGNDCTATGCHGRKNW